MIDGVMTEQQAIVKEYLEALGYKCRTDGRSGHLRFRPRGASSAGGYVFRNGCVYIHNEHTDPFNSSRVLFTEIAEKVKGAQWVTQYKKHWKRVGLPTTKKGDISPRFACTVNLSEDECELPDRFSVCANALERKNTKIWTRDMVLSWIREPPREWQAVRSSVSQTAIKKKTPCLFQNVGDCRILWLDIDQKDNGTLSIDALADRMWDDPRVAIQFRTLSRNLAVGVLICAPVSTHADVANYIVDAFERTYDVAIDRTCTRPSQLRALSCDPSARCKSKALYYYTEEELEMDDTIRALDRIAAVTESIANAPAEPLDFQQADSMLDELKIIVDALDIHIDEDVWTGRREFSIGGRKVKDCNGLYLEMLNLAQKRNSNSYGFTKQTIVDYLMSSVVETHDIVLDTVFGAPWDGVERWQKLKGALHLTEVGLKWFQLWMRQGAMLLYNTGAPTDVQRNFMLILYSRSQHIGKTTLARLLSCGTNSFTQKGLDLRNKDTLIDLYSHWIYEYGELGTTFRRTDTNQIKNFVTDTTMTYRRPYDREGTLFPVRTSIIGTTNEEDLFIDPSGNRRYLVIDCAWTRDDWSEIDQIDFVQLWRQARYEVLQGMPYTLSQEDQALNEILCANKRFQGKEFGQMMGILNRAMADNGLVNGRKIWAHNRKDDMVWINRDALGWVMDAEFRTDIKSMVLSRCLEMIGCARDRSGDRDRYSIGFPTLRCILEEYWRDESTNK